jgi:hypothetical protein
MKSRPPPTFEDETIVWSPPDWDAEDDATITEPEPIRPSVTETPRAAVEVEVRKISPQAVKHVRIAYEIWTKNRVYNLDANLQCFDVIDLATGTSNEHHPFVGARLVGGQLREREGEHAELSFPLPAPGSDAVFQKMDDQQRIRLAVTSSVTRVILHIHQVEVRGPERDHAWGRITRTGH